MENKVINILMIEDDTLDVMDAQRTLDRMGLLYIMQVMKNGEEGMAYLERTEKDNTHVRPDIILLDLNMPKMNGVEFLQALRKDDRFRDLRFS
jgi:CheY-like chemotaxis protein